ncbi:MAG: hypothetical protein AAF664_12445 [Planctomycetota bacterium]
MNRICAILILASSFCFHGCGKQGGGSSQSAINASGDFETRVKSAVALWEIPSEYQRAASMLIRSDFGASKVEECRITIDEFNNASTAIAILNLSELVDELQACNSIITSVGLSLASKDERGIAWKLTDVAELDPAVTEDRLKLVEFCPEIAGFLSRVPDKLATVLENESDALEDARALLREMINAPKYKGPESKTHRSISLRDAAIREYVKSGRYRGYSTRQSGPIAEADIKDLLKKWRATDWEVEARRDRQRRAIADQETVKDRAEEVANSFSRNAKKIRAHLNLTREFRTWSVNELDRLEKEHVDAQADLESKLASYSGTLSLPPLPASLEDLGIDIP